jgi:hypothetical protein
MGRGQRWKFKQPISFGDSPVKDRKKSFFAACCQEYCSAIQRMNFLPSVLFEITTCVVKSTDFAKSDLRFGKAGAAVVQMCR